MVHIKDLEFLSKAGERLASSLDYQETLHNIVHLLLPRWGDYCVVYVLDAEGRAARVASAHNLPHMVPVLEEFCKSPMDASFDSSIGAAMRDQKSKRFVTNPEAYEKIPLEGERRALLRKLNPTSGALIPLVVGGKSIGALMVVRSGDGPTLKETEIQVLEELARRIAYAVDHARLFELLREESEARKKNERDLRYLTQASLVLSSSLDYETTLANVASMLVPELATWCGVDLLEPDGTLKRVTVAHEDPERVRWAREFAERYPTDPASKTGVPNVIRTGNAEIHSHVTDEMVAASGRDEEFLRFILEAEIRSVIIVPLVSRQQTIGAVTLVHRELGAYGPRELELAKELAHRAAISVDKARLFKSLEEELAQRRLTEAALAESEKRFKIMNLELEQRVEERTADLVAANRELESFSYSVSHDLRSPLRGIIATSHMLLADYGDLLNGEGKEMLKTQSMAAKNMSALIDALLQLSRLGSVELVRVEFDVTRLAEEITEELLAIEWPCPIQFKIARDLKAYADPRLMRSALQNLLENACKYSCPNRTAIIEVGCKEKNSEQIFYVRDNGIGFDMQYVNKLFAPFERLSPNQDSSGLGIGLANVQRIVQRHGGRIWAESVPDKGSTFSFTLR